MTTIPDFMPILGEGYHETPRDGACAMEMASILAGEDFSDHPRCADANLSAIVRFVNDIFNDDDRQRLIPFIARVIGTRLYDVVFEDGVWTKLGSTFIPTPSEWDVAMNYMPRIGDVFNPQRWVQDGFQAEDSTTEVLRRLTEVFDAFDQITGHRPRQGVDLAALEQQRRELAGVA